MPNIFGERDETQIIGAPGYGYGYGGGGGGGFGGLGGIGAIIALVAVVAVLWFLGREGKDNGYNNGGCNMPYPYPPYPAYPPYAPPYGGGNCCSPLDCKIPMAIDMSNCEVDKDIWKMDAHMERCCCETKEVTHNEAEATRALINANTMQELRDKLSQSYSEKSALESKYFTEKEVGGLKELILKIDNGNDKQIACLAGAIKDLKCDIDCNIPKRPPMWCEGITPNTHHTDCQHDDFPRRSKGGCGCGFGCGND